MPAENAGKREGLGGLSALVLCTARCPASTQSALWHPLRTKPPVCSSPVQCEAQFFAVVGSFLATELPDLVPRDAAAAAAAAADASAGHSPSASSPADTDPGAEAALQLGRHQLQRLQSFVYELEASLLLAYAFLLRRQPFYAPIAPGLVASYAGWDLPELDGAPISGTQPCWEQVALLRASKLVQGVGAGEGRRPQRTRRVGWCSRGGTWPYPDSRVGAPNFSEAGLRHNMLLRCAVPPSHTTAPANQSTNCTLLPLHPSCHCGPRLQARASTTF